MPHWEHLKRESEGTGPTADRKSPVIGRDTCPVVTPSSVGGQRADMSISRVRAARCTSSGKPPHARVGLVAREWRPRSCKAQRKDDPSCAVRTWSCCKKEQVEEVLSSVILLNVPAQLPII